MPTESLTARQWQNRILKTRNKIMADRKRVWPEGTTKGCPVCKKRTLQGCSDISREVDSDGVVLVFANLHGARCSSCGTEFVEMYEQIAIEERAGTTFRGSIEGSVTALGGNKLGTYWPKDVAAALDMHARDTVRITLLAPDTAVLRLIHRHEATRAAEDAT